MAFIFIKCNLNSIPNKYILYIYSLLNDNSLRFDDNNINKIKNLPSHLISLYICKNKINRLENLPLTLKTLNISINKITKLENLPRSLYYLNNKEYIHPPINYNDYLTSINSTEDCPICYIDDSNCKLSCGHYYHKECIKQCLAIKFICPYCQQIPTGIE